MLAARLYASSPVQIKGARTLPDWPTMHRELRRKGVTLHLLWQEHRLVHPDGHGYSQFCDLYRAWNVSVSQSPPRFGAPARTGGDMFVVF